MSLEQTHPLSQKMTEPRWVKHHTSRMSSDLQKRNAGVCQADLIFLRSSEESFRVGQVSLSSRGRLSGINMLPLTTVNASSQDNWMTHRYSLRLGWKDVQGKRYWGPRRLRIGESQGE